MGCCVSTPGAAPGAQGNLPANSSSRAIVAQPPSIHRPSTQASNASNRPTPHARSRQPRQPLESHINRPLRPHVWAMTSQGHQWTRTELDGERRDFFDTRTDGRLEIWQTLRSALEVMWAGGNEVDGGVATAQEILNAAEITLPSGDMSNGAYDAFGHYYQLPFYIVADPSNLGTGAVAEGAKDEDDVDKSEESEELDEEVLRRREAKGKAVVKPNDTFPLRARRSDGVPGDLVINVSKGDSVKLVARRLKVAAGLPPEKRLRIVQLGKILDEKKSLQDEGWQEKYVVNAYVSG